MHWKNGGGQPRTGGINNAVYRAALIAPGSNADVMQRAGYPGNPTNGTRIFHRIRRPLSSSLVIIMTAGEKENGTLPTLLCAPINHLELLAGKYLAILAIALVGVIAPRRRHEQPYQHGP